MDQTIFLPEPDDVLFRIQRGLAGYVSYLAACEMNTSFSEYVLYEPILRILTARGYIVECEAICPGIDQPATGDKKKIDFVANINGIQLAIEVKWVKDIKPDFSNDKEKLTAFKMNEKNNRAFLCIFGRKSHLSIIVPPFESFKEFQQDIYADLKRTKYGCRIFELYLNL
jgi:hypothetical protein